MSHDFWLEVGLGGPEPSEITEWRNYTRNVSPMWRKAMTTAAGREMSVQDTDGMKASDALALFYLAATHMQDYPQEYEPMNPANRWGSYDGALQYLRDIAADCRQHPNATVRWSV